MFGINSDKGYHEVADGIRIKTVNYGQETLMTEFTLKKGSVLPEHSHVHEQTGYLVKGRMDLRIGGISRILSPGDSWNVPSNVRHGATVLEDSVAVEVFAPRRDEYLKFVCGDDIVNQSKE